MTKDAPRLRLIDQQPEIEQFRDEVLQGLLNDPKFLPCKYLYDRRGSDLFEQICDLEEYYPTSTEIAILEANIAEIAAVLETGTVLIEYGSGSSRKTRILLDAARNLEAYVPVDISIEQLKIAATALARAYPTLTILPVCADYTGPFELPTQRDHVKRRIVYYPGSTIGNFEPDDARVFLERIAGVVEQGGGLLIGVDLRKEARILEAAYDDSHGITAEFNLNLLRRINEEFGSDFDLEQFRHKAIYDKKLGRIEMHLVSDAPQSVRFDGRVIPFEKGETIHTENSYKYTLDGFADLCRSAGFRVERVWTDPKGYFSVQYLTVPRSGSRTARSPAGRAESGDGRRDQSRTAPPLPTPPQG